MSKPKTERPRGGQKEPIGFRWTPEGKRLLRALSEKLGLSQGGVAELAVRQMAKKEGLE